jgi:F-type H+-transporting ATPase subunit epsilon
MRVTVLAPERPLYEGEAVAVVAPAYDGQVGILPQHAAFLTLLGEGMLSVQHEAGTSQFRVAGGFLQVREDVVRVVAAGAEPQPGA